MESTTRSARLWQQTSTFLQLLFHAMAIVMGIRIVVVIIIALTGHYPQQPYLEEFTEKELLFFGLIVAPLLESLLIIGFLWLFTRRLNQEVATLLTAAIFGLLHLDTGVDGFTVLMISLAGYIYIRFYYKARQRGISGYWLMVVIHLLDNAISVSSELIQYMSS